MFSVQKLLKSNLLLILVLVIAFSLRVYTARFPYLLLNDEWMHYDRARRLLETGSYPAINYYDGVEGSHYYVAGYEGMYFLPFVVYKPLSLLDIPFFHLFQILPALLGTLSIIPLYLIAKEFYDKETALLCSAFFAVTLASTERSLAGYYRGDVFMLFFMLWALYFFFKKKESYRNIIVYSLSSSASLFLSGIMWVGWPFAFLSLSLSYLFLSLFSYFTGKGFKNYLMSYSIISLLGLGSLYIFKRLFFLSCLSLPEKVVSTQLLEIETFLLLFLALLFITLIMGISYKMKTRWKFLILLGVVFSLFVFNHFTHYGTTYFNNMYETHRYLDPELIDRTVSEQTEVNFTSLTIHFGIILLLFPLGLLFYFMCLSKERIMLLGWLSASLGVMMLMLRFSFIGSPVVYIISTLGVGSLLEKNKKAFMLVIAFLLLVNLFVSARLVMDTSPLIDEDWAETLSWIEKNAPQDAIFLSWWNYPWLIEVLGKRKTLGGGFPQVLNKEQYTFFVTEDPQKGLEIAKKYSITHVILDSEMWKYWSRMLEYAGMQHHPLDKSFAYNLYMGKNIPNFELMYENDNIRLFHIKYPKKIIIEKGKSDFLKSETVYKNIIVESELKHLHGTLEIFIHDPSHKAVYRSAQEISLPPLSKVSIPLHWTPTSDSRNGDYQISIYFYEKLPKSKRFLTFSYRKTSPSSYVSLYFMANGYWHQVGEGSKTYYQGIPIESRKDIEWHTVTVDLEAQKKGTNDDPLVSSYGRIEYFQLSLYGKPGDVALFDSINFFDDSGESIIFDGLLLGDVSGWGSDGFQGYIVDGDAGKKNFKLIIQENNNSTTDTWRIVKKSFGFSLFKLEGKKDNKMDITYNIEHTYESVTITGEVKYKSNPIEGSITLVQGENVFASEVNAGKFNFFLKRSEIQLFDGENALSLYAETKNATGSKTITFSQDYSFKIENVQYFINGEWIPVENIVPVSGDHLMIRFTIKSHDKQLNHERVQIFLYEKYSNKYVGVFVIIEDFDIDLNSFRDIVGNVNVSDLRGEYRVQILVKDTETSTNFSYSFTIQKTGTTFVG